MVEFLQLLSDSDYISIHAPLTKETRHRFAKNELKVMKRTAYLINTREAIINEKALYEALKRGWIAVAALDVMEKEPPYWGNPLLTTKASRRRSRGSGTAIPLSSFFDSPHS